MFILKEEIVPPQKENLFSLLMAGASKPVYILGCNKYAQRVCRSMLVQGFIDDFTKETVYMQKPVMRMTDLKDDCIVVSCVVDARSLTALDRLRKVGVKEVIDYFTLSRMAPEVFTSVDYFSGNRQDILENQAEYQNVYNRFADNTSKQQFAKVVQFRLNLDLNHMQGFTCSLDRQYFEDFLPLKPGDVFVDGGGYDGETTLQFIARNRAYKRIYYFEPTPAMMNISKANITNQHDVCFIEKGLFCNNARLRFNAGAAKANSLSATGEIEIEVVRLDDEVKEPITIIKLDIEGAEYDALEGAAEHIRMETPTIVACVYHNQQDFWRIPRRVLEINDRYDLYFRHYTESILESVMFFIPRQKE